MRKYSRKLLTISEMVTINGSMVIRRDRNGCRGITEGVVVFSGPLSIVYGGKTDCIASKVKSKFWAAQCCV